MKNEERLKLKKQLSNVSGVLPQLSIANKLRCSAFGHEIEDWSWPQWGNAVAGEVGEMCNLIKKIDRGDTDISIDDIANEAADIVIYLDLLCQSFEINLQNSIVNKFNEKSEQIKSDIKIYYY